MTPSQRTSKAAVTDHRTRRPIRTAYRLRISTLAAASRPATLPGDRGHRLPKSKVNPPAAFGSKTWSSPISSSLRMPTSETVVPSVRPGMNRTDSGPLTFTNRRGLRSRAGHCVVDIDCSSRDDARATRLHHGRQGGTIGDLAISWTRAYVHDLEPHACNPVSGPSPRSRWSYHRWRGLLASRNAVLVPNSVVFVSSFNRHAPV